MTACTNNGGKARRVVTAALVGVLSVGAVPAIALATGTGDAAGSEVSVLAVTIWDGATIASATNGQPNESVSEEDLKNGVSFESDSHEYLVPTALVIDGETQRVKDDWAVTYTMDTYSSDPSTAASFTGLTMGWEYYDASRGTGSMFTFNGTLSADQAAAYFGGTLRGNKGQVVSVLPGTYHVTVSGAVDGTAGSATFNFKVVSPAPEQHTYTVEGNLTYDGFDKKGELTFRNEDGIAETPTDWKNGDGSTHTGAITDAGTYFAVMPGGEQVKFVVEQLDLSAATVTIEDIVSPDSDGNGYGDIMSNAYVLSKVKVGGYDVSDAVIKIGERQDAVNYRFGVNTVTILPVAGDSANIKGFASVTFTVLNDSVFSGAHRLMYGDEDITGSRVINVSSYDREAFDSSKLSVVFDGVTYSGEQLDVTVDGDLTKQGPHTVHVRVEPFQKDGVWYGGTQDITVWVSRADLDANERLYFYLDGKLAGNGATVTYDGGNWLDRLEVVVRDANGNELVNGEDYDVTVTKGGSEVDSAVDAGTYKVKVTGKTFDFQYGGVDTFTLNVNQLVIDRIVPVWDLDVEGTPDGYLYYTGDVLTPAYRFFDWVDDEYVEVEVPAEAYEVTYMKGGKDVDLKEVGTYTADFDTAVDEKNYVVDKDVQIYVTDKKVFLDVPMNEWYSQGVYDAVKLGYMNGDGGGKTFGPMRELTRAEAACVLFNMAGGDDMYADATVPGYDVENKVYDTDYTDVEGNEFFAKAIAWCKATGIINGYADGTFGVSRNVTNEEFACMLANYAKAKGDYKAVDADETLAAYPDASVVSDWAKDAVAWCVSEGIMGGGANISPAGSILRMRAATMAVNAQPEKLSDLVITIPSVNK